MVLIVRVRIAFATKWAAPAIRVALVSVLQTVPSHVAVRLKEPAVAERVARAKAVPAMSKAADAIPKQPPHVMGKAQRVVAARKPVSNTC